MMFKVGDKVQFKGRMLSHHAFGGIPIEGVVGKVDYDYYEGRHSRPIRVDYKIGETETGTWVASSEIKGTD